MIDYEYHMARTLHALCITAIFIAAVIVSTYTSDDSKPIILAISFVLIVAGYFFTQWIAKKYFETRS